MAKINFGAAVLDARGKLGGMVYSANKAGAYIRRKASPTGTTTPAQARVRANFGSNSKIWSGTLDDTTRQAWSFFAAANPISDVFGNSIVISGMAMMQRLNQVLLQALAAIISNPPADLNVDPIPDVTGAAVTVVAGSIATVHLPTAAQAAPADTSYYVFATGMLAAGKTAQKNQYRFLGVFAPAAAAVFVDVSAAWIAKYSSAPISGNKVAFLVAQVSITKGALTPGLKVVAVVP